MTSIKALSMRCLAIIKSTKKAGIITLKVSGENVPEQVIEIESKNE